MVVFYGIWSTAHAIGEGLTFVVVAGVVAFSGWRGGFFGPGLMCIATAVVIYIIYARIDHKHWDFHQLLIGKMIMVYKSI